MSRKHQSDLEYLCRRFAAKEVKMPRLIICDVAPGGGKGSIPVILAHWLISRGGLAEKICWVVPNGSLRDQAVEAFGRDKWVYKHLGHELEIMQSTNVSNPSKGTCGYITTYQALRADASGFNVDEFKLFKYILVIDEGHHAAVGSPYAQALAPLVARARLTVVMSGAIERADRKPIYLLPYGDDRRVNRLSSEDTRWIRYSVREATAEQAILRLHFQHIDGATSWYDENGMKQEAEKLGDNPDALFTALHTQYAGQLLDRCLEDWQRYRRLKNRRGKCLVVCANTTQAQGVMEHIRRRGFTDVERATYKDDAPEESIGRFRNCDAPSILVTVAMAYEGMDVPCISHIACLTHIRSTPWILQMLARGWRVDERSGLPWHNQLCYAFVPDDYLFRQCIAEIELEQQLGVRDIEGGGGPGPGPGPDGPVDPEEIRRITPLVSTMTEERASELYGVGMSSDETRFYQQFASDFGLAKSPLETREMCEELERRRKQEPAQVGPVSEVPQAMPHQRLRALRTALEQAVRDAARGDGQKCAEINTRLKSEFGPREELEEDSLLAALKRVRESYGS